MHVWRINGSYFPLILLICYALYFMCHRVKAFVVPVALIYGIASVSCGVMLFSPETQNLGNTSFTRYGETIALIHSKNLPFEHMYIRVEEENNDITATEMRVLYFHAIKAPQWRGEEPLPSGKMYADTYEFWYESDGPFEYDSEENAAYVLRASDLDTFDEEGFTLLRFYDGALAYPTQYMTKQGEDLP